MTVIEKLLSTYANAAEFNTIDCKKHFAAIIEGLQPIINTIFCYQSDERRQRKGQMDEQVVKKLEEYFCVVY